MKEFKVVIPEGMEIDKENSTFECIKFKPKASTYEDVAKELFGNNSCCYTGCDGSIKYASSIEIGKAADPNNATSEKQLQKLLAINKLMNVAKYLNAGWTPNWNNGTAEPKYFFCGVKHERLAHEVTFMLNLTTIYFKSPELLQRAVDILGKDTICLALSTDW